MLIREVADLSTDSTLADAQEIGAQLQTAMEDLYYAHRMGSPNPTVKQNIDMLQKSIRSLNQELNALGYKYAPTVPGLVARIGTRFVEENMNIDQIITEFAPPGGNDREPDEHEILRQLAAQWYHGDEDPRAEKTLAAMGWERGQDESGDDDAGVFVIRAGDENGHSYIAFPHSELSLDEGFRVSAPQIRGTQNRAQSAYYPTNVKPQVPRLDKPLSDQELVRLSQLAGIKNNK